MRAWLGLLRLSRRSQQLERTEGESELSDLTRVAAANLEGWGHEADEGIIEHDLLRYPISSLSC